MLIYTENQGRSAAIHNVGTGITYVLRVEKATGGDGRPVDLLAVSIYSPTMSVVGGGNRLFGGEQAEAFWRGLLRQAGLPMQVTMAGAIWFMEKLAGRPVADVRPDGDDVPF